MSDGSQRSRLSWSDSPYTHPEWAVAPPSATIQAWSASIGSPHSSHRVTSVLTPRGYAVPVAAVQVPE